MRLLNHIPSKSGEHTLFISAETLKTIGAMALHLPDVAKQSVAVIRLSDIMAEKENPAQDHSLSQQFNRFNAKNPPPPPLISEENFALTSKGDPRTKDFYKAFQKFMELNDFQNRKIGNDDSDTFKHIYERKHTDPGYLALTLKNKDDSKTHLIISPEYLPDTKDFLAMVSQNMALPLKENIDFNRHTAHLFCLFHEAAHHAQPTTHIQAGEAFADKTAKDFLEYMKAQGHDEIDLQTIDTLFDLRTIATFQHAQARHFESDYVHGHSTGLLSREEDITDQRGEEHTQNLISLNGLVASLLGGALRPSVHAAIDKEYGQHASLIKNNLDEDTLSEIVKSPELYFLAMPALIELQASKIKYQSDDPEDKFKIFNQENIEIGAAFIKEHPGMHYAFIRGLYDGGFFDENIHTQNPLDKPYIKNYLEAYARIADITPEERAVSKNITQDVKNALPRLREIFSVSLSKEAKTEETNPIKTPVPETLLPKTVLPQP